VQDADIVRIQPEITAGGRDVTHDQQSKGRVWWLQRIRSWSTCARIAIIVRR
jgi:hypothetical protein